MAPPRAVGNPSRRELAALPLLALAVSCSSDGGDVPRALMDGSRALTAPVELEGVDGPTVLTRVRVVRVASTRGDSPTADCVRERARAAEVSSVAVERVSVSAQSVTLRDEYGRGLFACDDTPGAREASDRWCGGSYGVLESGRLRDPRLNVLCSTRDGEPVGLLWIEPHPTTRYVAVEQSGYTEVYAVTGGLPVRVATTVGVDLERSRADVAVSEHDARGTLVRSYQLHAEVAG